MKQTIAEMQVEKEIVNRSSWDKVDKTEIGLKKQISLERRVMKNDALISLDTHFTLKEANRVARKSNATFSSASKVAHCFDN